MAYDRTQHQDYIIVPQLEYRKETKDLAFTQPESY